MSAQIQKSTKIAAGIDGTKNSTTHSFKQTKAALLGVNKEVGHPKDGFSGKPRMGKRQPSDWKTRASERARASPEKEKEEQNQKGKQQNHPFLIS